MSLGGMGWKAGASLLEWWDVGKTSVIVSSFEDGRGHKERNEGEL